MFNCSYLVRAMGVANLCANHRCELARHQRQNVCLAAHRDGLQVRGLVIRGG